MAADPNYPKSYSHLLPPYQFGHRTQNREVTLQRGFFLPCLSQVKWKQTLTAGSYVSFQRYFWHVQTQTFVFSPLLFPTHGNTLHTAHFLAFYLIDFSRYCTSAPEGKPHSSSCLLGSSLLLLKQPHLEDI